MTVLEAYLVIVGIMVFVIAFMLFRKELKLGSIKLPRLKLTMPQNPIIEKPMETTIDKSVAAKAKWICEQGIDQLRGWKNIPKINIKFCSEESMPGNENGRVSGVFYFDEPDTIYINSAIILQSWLVSKIVLHELYHLYQFNVFGSTSGDEDGTVNRWSDEVMDTILFSKYYDRYGEKLDRAEFQSHGKFTRVKNGQYIGTIWSER